MQCIENVSHNVVSTFCEVSDERRDRLNGVGARDTYVSKNRKWIFESNAQYQHIQGLSKRNDLVCLAACLGYKNLDISSY